MFFQIGEGIIFDLNSVVFGIEASVQLENLDCRHPYLQVGHRFLISEMYCSLYGILTMDLKFVSHKPLSYLQSTFFNSLNYGYLKMLAFCFCVDRKHLVSGLCSRSTQVPQATNFYVWETGKIYFFHINFSTGHPGYHD